MSQPVSSRIIEYPVHLDGCPITLIRCEEVERPYVKEIIHTTKQTLFPYPGKMGDFKFSVHCWHADDEEKIESLTFKTRNKTSLFNKFEVVRYKNNKVNIELYTEDLDAASFLLVSGANLESVAQNEAIFRVILSSQKLKESFKIFTRYNKIPAHCLSKIHKLIRHQEKQKGEINLLDFVPSGYTP